MRRRASGWLALFFGFLLLTGIAADPPVLSSSPTQVAPPAAARAVRQRDVVLPAARTVQIANLRAVLIGAPIDGDTGRWTLEEIEHLRETAEVLRRYGVDVKEFYTPNNDWNEIRAAIEGAHFLMYRGHGVYDGNTPPRSVGGFALKGRFVSADEIRALHPAPGAIVMLYGCFTAGNAGFDIGQIDQVEADRRVAMYSQPFMEAGFSAYYANWFGDAFRNITHYLFAGKSMGEAYKSYSDFSAASVHYGNHPALRESAMWVDHDRWDGKIAYNYAFVGNPEPNLTDLFGGTVVEGEIRLSEEERQELAARAYRLIYAGDGAGAVRLIREGAHPDYAYNGWPLLILAVYKNQPETVRALIERGVNTNARLSNGQTALAIARSRNQTSIVSMLQEAGANASPASRSMLPEPAPLPE